MKYSLKQYRKFASSLLSNTFIRKFKYDYAICAIIKNEADYIEEWIEYHKKIGFEKFYIYDNESTDNVYIKLEKYIKEGIVDYIYCIGKGKQLFAYNDCVHRNKNKCRYIAFIDLDEFILPIEGESIRDTEEYLKKYAGFTINWVIFGSAGHIKKPDGSVLENYKYRSKEINMHIKTICNPRWVDYFENPHFPHYVIYKYSVDENYKRVDGPFNKDIPAKKYRINHYFCKSQEEARRKFSKGFADSINNNHRIWDEFVAHDINEVFDDSILNRR